MSKSPTNAALTAAWRHYDRIASQLISGLATAPISELERLSAEAGSALRQIRGLREVRP